MDFELTAATSSTAQTARALVTDVLPTLPADTVEFANAARSALGSRRLFAIEDTVAAVRSVVELARGSASLGAIAASGWVFADTLRRNGGAARAALASAASVGSVVGCVGFDDPRRRGGLRAAAAPRGFVLEGALSLVPNAPIATNAVVIAAAADSTLIVVHLDEATLDARRVSPPGDIGFSRLPRCSLDLTGVLVDESSLFAEGPPGATLGDALVDVRRILTASLALGLAERATDLAILHVKSERGRAAQSTDFLLADLATDLEAATLSVTRAAWLRDTGAPHRLESAAAKLLATRTATRALHGALGVVGEANATNDLRRAYLDARALELQDGPPAEQHDTIASVMLGER